MSGPINDDYLMSDADASELKGVVLLPHEIRQLALQRYLESHGTASLVNLFSQFIGMANSVVASNREMAELLLITDGEMHPYEAEKINLPTMFGALCGVALANGVNQKKTMCHGCAFRIGTAANQSPVTTCDAGYCQDDDLDFMCHEKLDAKGNPKSLCAGYAQRGRRASARVRNPFAPIDRKTGEPWGRK